MNKQELASTIWDGANKLRGKVNAAKYKDYMLGFLFYKYLSNKEVEYLKKNYYTDEEIRKLSENNTNKVNFCKNNIGYFIPYKNLYSTWRDPEDGKDFSVANVTKALSAFNDRGISNNYKEIYKDIFATLSRSLNDIGATDLERTKAIKQLFVTIDLIPTDSNQGYDVLGFIYEFLLKNFASNAKKAGEFYTPYEASYLMSEIVAHHLQGREHIDIYDPTSGTGSLLLNIGKTLGKYTSNIDDIRYYAQELNPETYSLTRMNLIMRGIIPGNISVRQGDTLHEDWPLEDTGASLLSIDACVSNPPYSQPWEPETYGNDPRFSEYGIAPKGKADYAFLLHSLYHLKQDGIMAIVLPHGVLSRGGTEAEIRTKLIEKHNIETIIGLPANMFYGTGIPTIIMVLKKQRRESDILFVDASRRFKKEGNKNVLTQSNIKEILDVVINRKTVKQFSRLVSLEEISGPENNYNLNISRYVDSQDKDEPLDIYSMVYGGIPNIEIEQLQKYWDAFPSLKMDIYKENNKHDSKIIMHEIKKGIQENKDVKLFVNKYEESFITFKDFLNDKLIKNLDNVNIAKLKEEISEDIRNRVGESLINFYDAYEIFSKKWSEISMDLEIIQSNGSDCIRHTEPIKEMKYDKKNKTIELKETGEEGKIIPLSLIQETYFHDDKNIYDNLVNETKALKDEKEELILSIEENDLSEIQKDDSEDISQEKLKKKAKEFKRLANEGVEYEEGSFGDIVIKIGDITNKISSNNKRIKEIQNTLFAKSKNKLNELRDAEINDLLNKKWIDPIYKSIIELSSDLINELSLSILNQEKRYNFTLNNISNEIIDVEKNICKMMEDLKSDEYNEKGIKGVIELLNGDENK